MSGTHSTAKLTRCHFGHACLYARAPLVTHVVPHAARCLQVEGVVADRGLGLGHLIGIITEFFNRIGITQLR